MAPSSPIPPTLLTLRLSSPSFLETILTNHNCPVYSTETYGSTTSISRCDPSNGLTLIANINWPDRCQTDSKGKSKFASAQLFINGSTLSEDELLKRNRFNTSRKFRIPGHSHSLKWRRVQGVFQCTSSTGTPVAVFEPAIITARARLNVFVSTLEGLPSPQPQVQDDEVSSILVDYLLVTALLLLTHPEDWHGFSSTPTPSPVPPLPSRAALPQLDIPASFSHSHAFHYPPQPHPASTSTPVSPITSAASETSSFSFSTSPPETPSQCWELEHAGVHGPCGRERSLSTPQLRQSNAPLCPDVEFKEVVEYEPPPPYEEIQWTVRVRQPRRLRT